ncbi:MAG: hypothetical protein GXP45_01150 [bacterium]|nr:hypothetical protein [bacterium]
MIYFFHSLMKLSPEQIIKLQKLSAVKISPDQEKDFFDKLSSVIAFLSDLQKMDLSHVTLKENAQNIWLSPRMGTQGFEDIDAIMENVQHEQINHSLVVKSVLD